MSAIKSLKLGKIGIIVAARTGSSRLPGKALLPLNGMPMILFLLRRLAPLKQGTVVLATTQLPGDDSLAAAVTDAGIPVFRGSAENLVDRYVASASHFGFDTVGRVTGDCPFVDAAMIDHCLDQAESGAPFDLATTKGAFPVGLDVELYPSRIMQKLQEQSDLSAAHREHLTLYMYEHTDRFALRQLTPPGSWPRTDRSFTVDTPDDYKAAQTIVGAFSGAEFSIANAINRVAT